MLNEVARYQREIREGVVPHFDMNLVTDAAFALDGERRRRLVFCQTTTAQYP